VPVSKERSASPVGAAAGAAEAAAEAAPVLSPIDAKAPGLKRPSKALKKFLLCVVRMAKKPLSVVRDIKKVMVFPSNIFLVSP
jgi:hypothetical protein